MIQVGNAKITGLGETMLLLELCNVELLTYPTMYGRKVFADQARWTYPIVAAMETIISYILNNILTI